MSTCQSLISFALSSGWEKACNQCGVNSNQIRIVSCTLYIGLLRNNHNDFMMDELKFQFCKYGSVVDVRPFPKNKPYNHVFIQYSSRNEAKRAKIGIKKLRLWFIKFIQWAKPFASVKHFKSNTGVGIMDQTTSSFEIDDKFDIRNLCDIVFDSDNYNPDCITKLTECIKGVSNLPKNQEAMEYLYKQVNVYLDNISSVSVHWNGQRRKSHYVGLINEDKSCYLNSIIQQLFMIQEFRDEILDDDNNVLHRTFELMNNKLHEKSFYPIDIIQKYQAYEQQDCTEMLDRILNDKDVIDLSEKYFEGKLRWIMEYECGCIGTKAIDEVFRILKLSVENVTSLHQSLKEEFDKHTIYDFHCTVCNKKVKLEKQCMILKPPSYLFVSLKRFKYDNRYGCARKVNSKVEFSQLIDLKTFIYSVNDDINKINNFNYHLKGIIIHRGLATSGHYFSIIQQSDEWYCFDDESVRKFKLNAKNMNQYAFGGKIPIKDNNGNNVMVDNDCSAYVLLYERQHPSQKKIRKRIYHENFNLTKYEILTKKEYINFFRELYQEFTFNASVDKIQGFIKLLFSVVYPSTKPSEQDFWWNQFCICCSEIPIMVKTLLELTELRNYISLLFCKPPKYVIDQSKIFNVFKGSLLPKLKKKNSQILMDIILEAICYTVLNKLVGHRNEMSVLLDIVYIIIKNDCCDHYRKICKKLSDLFVKSKESLNMNNYYDKIIKKNLKSTTTSLDEIRIFKILSMYDKEYLTDFKSKSFVEIMICSTKLCRSFFELVIHNDMKCSKMIFKMLINRIKNLDILHNFRCFDIFCVVLLHEDQFHLQRLEQIHEFVNLLKSNIEYEYISVYGIQALYYLAKKNDTITRYIKDNVKDMKFIDDFILKYTNSKVGKQVKYHSKSMSKNEWYQICENIIKKNFGSKYHIENIYNYF